MAGATGSGEVRSLRNRIRRLAWVFFGGRTDGRTDGQTRERAVFKQSAYVEFYVSWARACPDFKVHKYCSKLPVLSKVLVAMQK